MTKQIESGELPCDFSRILVRIYISLVLSILTVLAPGGKKLVQEEDCFASQWAKESSFPYFAQFLY